MRDYFTISRQQFWMATVVVACVALISLFYVWITWDDVVKSESAENQGAGREIQADANDNGLPGVNVQTEAVNGEPLKENKAGNEVVSSTAGYMLPVQGEVFRDHSMTELTYYPTLNQYMTHAGIDILAQEGTAVCAAADGLVSKVMNDKTMGKTIWIAHPGEIITVYSNLNEEVAVEEGDNVVKGQTIGTSGKTSLFEKADEPHVHIGVLVKGEPADPGEYFKY